ncbi:MAG: IS21 family transposase [Nitrospira sp.]|nr:IS21 family transposase [Nitrospira sp.]MDF0675719.1 IS21 family transposase [Nitrospira sp.]MDF0675736.1 IS21 family transposase [Nitrospira sp.]
MELDETNETTIMRPQVDPAGEACMVDEARWAEIRRLFDEARVSISEIGRRVDLDRKTVRRSLRQPTWQPYQRAVVAAILLTAHADCVRARAPQVGYSARILYQALRAHHGSPGSYETVKRFVAPLREVQLQADRALLRFETPPGQQSQIDWGQATVPFRAGPVVIHVFVLTLGFSRRGVYHACADERLAQFLEAHERAFAHFGGHTREHLYDRPRTVCYADETGRRIWNPTFNAFADDWGFEPRVCRPYRAQTKGQVESGVKYLKRNFLPGRTFIDVVDFQTQLDEWTATSADQRLHGTTHEQPIVRFEREREQLVPLAGQQSFQQEARVSRIVADDYLVSLDTNRYSVPFRFIGQRVEVQRRGERVPIFSRDREVATHPVLSGHHQFGILPEHGPGAIARLPRQRRSTIHEPGPRAGSLPEVESRDLACYEALCGSAAAHEVQP